MLNLEPLLLRFREAVSLDIFHALATATQTDSSTGTMFMVDKGERGTGRRKVLNNSRVDLNMWPEIATKLQTLSGMVADKSDDLKRNSSRVRGIHQNNASFTKEF